MSVGSDKLRLLRGIPSVRFAEEMRGYSKSEVDRVLANLAPLADEIEALQRDLDEANARAEEANNRAAAASRFSDGPAPAAAPDGDFDETLRNTLLLAQRTADQTVRDAESRAEEVRRESTGKADSVMAGARAEAKELKGEAHAQREQMLADAESERAELLADALEHAESRKQAIEEELLSEQGIRRNELLAEISQLERNRDDLNADVVRFEEFLDGRRQSVRDALTEMTAVLDDPALLAEADVPEPADIGLLDPEELTGLNVESHSIGALGTEVDAAKQQAEEMAIPAESEPEESLDVSGEAPEFDQASETVSFDAIPAEDVSVPLEDSYESPADEFAAAVQAEPSFDPPMYTEAPVVETTPVDPSFDDGVAEGDVPSFDEPADLAVDQASSFEQSIPDPALAPDPAAEAQWQDVPVEQPADVDPFATEGFAEQSAVESLAAPETQPFPEAPQAEYVDAAPFADEVAAEMPPPPVVEEADGFGELGGQGIPASVTSDSVFSSVPETADPNAYSDLPAPVEQAVDPAGLGIDVESPFAEASPEAVEPGLGGLAEQARNRLASRVSRFRDNAVPESELAEEEEPAPPVAPAVDHGFAAEAPQADTPYADAPFTDAPQADAPFQPPEQLPPPQPEAFVEQAPQFPPPPESGGTLADSTPAFASDPVGGAEWAVSDPNRPLHPDARIEDLPPDDPFLDELRQMTGGEQPGSDDETLNRFLNEDGQKDGGGWFGRRGK